MKGAVLVVLVVFALCKSTHAACGQQHIDAERRFKRDAHETDGGKESLGITNLVAWLKSVSPLGKFGNSYSVRDNKYSLHTDGRAVDWMLDACQADQERDGSNIVSLLVADGGKLARSFGVSTIIWKATSYSMNNYKAKNYEMSLGKPTKVKMHATWDCAAGQGAPIPGGGFVGKSNAHYNHVHIDVNKWGAECCCNGDGGAYGGSSGGNNGVTNNDGGTANDGTTNGGTHSQPEDNRWWERAVGLTEHNRNNVRTAFARHYHDKNHMGVCEHMGVYSRERTPAKGLCFVEEHSESLCSARPVGEGSAAVVGGFLGDSCGKDGKAGKCCVLQTCHSDIGEEGSCRSSCGDGGRFLGSCRRSKTTDCADGCGRFRQDVKCCIPSQNVGKTPKKQEPTGNTTSWTHRVWNKATSTWTSIVSGATNTWTAITGRSPPSPHAEATEHTGGAESAHDQQEHCTGKYDGARAAAAAVYIAELYNRKGVQYSQSKRQFGESVTYSDCSAFLQSVLEKAGYGCLFTRGKARTKYIREIVQERGGSWRKTDPKPGDIMMWTVGNSGHTAMVAEVCNNGQGIKMAHMGKSGSSWREGRLKKCRPYSSSGVGTVVTWGNGGAAAFNGFWTPTF